MTWTYSLGQLTQANPVQIQMISHSTLWILINNEPVCEGTYTDVEREELILGMALVFGIWEYLILEYSLSFVLFLCKRPSTTWQTATDKRNDHTQWQHKRSLFSALNSQGCYYTDSGVMVIKWVVEWGDSSKHNPTKWIEMLPALPPVSSGLCRYAAVQPCKWTYIGLQSGPCRTAADALAGWSLGCRCHSPVLRRDTQQDVQT